MHLVHLDCGTTVHEPQERVCVPGFYHRDTPVDVVAAGTCIMLE